MKRSRWLPRSSVSPSRNPRVRVCSPNPVALSAIDSAEPTSCESLARDMNRSMPPFSSPSQCSRHDVRQPGGIENLPDRTGDRLVIVVPSGVHEGRCLVVDQELVERDAGLRRPQRDPVDPARDPIDRGAVHRLEASYRFPSASAGSRDGARTPGSSVASNAPARSRCALRAAARTAKPAPMMNATR